METSRLTYTKMPKFYILLLLLVIASCKSPEEKVKENIIKNAKNFFEKSTGDNISDISISKIDTVTQKREMLMICSFLKNKAETEDNLGYADFLYSEANKYFQKARKSDSITSIGYSVSLDYKAKDQYGMVEYKKEVLPFYTNGEMENLLDYTKRLFKRNGAAEIFNEINGGQ